MNNACAAGRGLRSEFLPGLYGYQRCVTGNSVLLALVVATALGFDFTNGFHDTGNAMATSIATGALPPRVAVAVSSVLNLVGAFLSFSVAATIAGGLVQTHLVTLTVVFAGLAGGILWNLATWYPGIPSSSSHALIGGVVGSTLAAAGGHAVQWHGLVSKVVLPALLSPVIAGLVAAVGTFLVYRITRSVPDELRGKGFRIGQIGSASMVSLAHGTNDVATRFGSVRPDPGRPGPGRVRFVGQPPTGRPTTSSTVAIVAKRPASAKTVRSMTASTGSVRGSARISSGVRPAGASRCGIGWVAVASTTKVTS
jgi:hypothetical protein